MFFCEDDYIKIYKWLLKQGKKDSAFDETYELNGDEMITMTLVHVFAFERDDIPLTENLRWVQPHKLHTYELAPCVEQIVARTFFRDPFFFEEFNQAW